MKSRLILSLMILLSSVEIGHSQRIKDIVDIQGVRGNPLTGIGLVVGLANTGDSSLPSQQMLANILKDSGQVFSPSDFTGGNVALVAVTAELGPFAHAGSQITATVSSREMPKVFRVGYFCQRF
ncbi:MAG: flagellar basal body P-ring protein FlgI [Planctomycetota bacterium]|jgi:flagellar P-ring protein precursor FlgI